MLIDNLKRALKTGEGAHHQLEKLVEELAIDTACTSNTSSFDMGCGECAVCVADQAYYALKAENDDAKQK